MHIVYRSLCDYDSLCDLCQLLFDCKLISADMKSSLAGDVRACLLM